MSLILRSLPFLSFLFAEKSPLEFVPPNRSSFDMTALGNLDLSALDTEAAIWIIENATQQTTSVTAVFTSGTVRCALDADSESFEDPAAAIREALASFG